MQFYVGQLFSYQRPYMINQFIDHLNILFITQITKEYKIFTMSKLPILKIYYLFLELS